MRNSKPRKWKEEELATIVALSANFTEVLRRLNLCITGGNRQTIFRWIKKKNISTAHFNADKARLHALYSYRAQHKCTDEEIFCQNSKVGQSVLRKRARIVIVPQVCNECSNDGIYMGKPLILELEHRNGNRKDNRKENLCWLCPNCHSQTATYAGRNK